MRVSVDTSVVDTSRTVIKLVGRAQGELNSSDFVELRDGTYRLKGIAKDDYYTLTVKTYDRMVIWYLTLTRTSQSTRMVLSTLSKIKVSKVNPLNLLKATLKS